MNKEAHITINGTTLLGGQSMAVRVAISSFLSEISLDGLGDDEHARKMSELYIARLGEVLHLIGEIND
jgi:hypothetical protein